MAIRTLSGPPDGRFEIVDATRRVIGECPTWDEGSQAILFASITEGTIQAIPAGAGESKVYRLPAPIGSFGLCRSRRLVVALRDRVVLYDLATGEITLVATVAHRIGEMRLNDGKVGPDGAFWVGSMDDRDIPAKEPIGRLYRIAANGSCTVIADGLRISNGLAWSPDGRLMYHSDSRSRWVDVWDFDPVAGAASNRRRFLTLTDEIGRPDGAACDLSGNYWSAGPSGGALNCFSPRGELVQSIRMPNHRPTMVCFGGSDMRTIFVTSLSEGLSEEALAAHPLVGTLLATRVDAVGAPVARFDA